ncbi:MAG: outer membrane beta-barrel protein [Oligoflexia bacterium]|nr:outer membrane beta-barrel protein [Oligoflexia bacterium]
MANLFGRFGRVSFSLGVLTAIFASTSTPAFAASPALSLVGLSNWSSPSDSPDLGGTSKAAYGGGAYLDLPLVRRVSLQIGALYVPHKTDFVSASQTVTANSVQVPALLNFHFNRFLTFGFGGYYARYIGQFRETNDSTGIQSNSNYSDVGLMDSDYGVVGSVAMHVPVAHTVDFTVDGRYNYGLKNLVSDPSLTPGGLSSEKTRDIQVLAGFTFHI